MNAEDRMTKIYRAAMREIKDSLFGIDPTTFTPARASRIREDVRTTVRALDYAASSWTQKEIPRAYTESAKTSRVALEILGRTATKKAKKTPIAPIAEKTLDFYLEANRSIIKTVDRYLSVVQMARTAITKAAVQEFNFNEPDEAEWLKDRARYAVEAEQSKGKLKRDIKDHLQDLVVDGKMIEVNGKNWAMDKYADLVARTSLRDAATDATRDLCAQYANDLVEVSSHATDCDICEEFEGKIYSLSGLDPKYPALDEYPPFHPNCKHSILPTSEEAINAREWEKKQQEPTTPSPPPPAPPPPPPTPPKAAAPAPTPAAAPATPVPAAPPNWKPAATKAEAEAWARVNVAPIADYSKVSLDVANILNKNLAESLVSKGIRIDGVAPSAIVKKEFQTHQGKNFVMAVYSKETIGPGGVGTRKIMLAYNPNCVGSIEKMNHTIANLENSNALKILTQDGLIQHEIGHVIDFMKSAKWNRASKVLYNQWTSKFSSLTDQAAAQTAVKGVVGNYIFHNVPEFFAECFRLYKADKLPAQMDFVRTYFQNLGW